MIVAHGSRDPAAAVTTRALARLVASGYAGPVRAAFLDHTAPRPEQAVAALAGAHPTGPGPTGAGPAGVVVVVPLLLTAAYHGRVDLPEALARVPAMAVLADVVGPVGGVVPRPLVAALRRRLREAVAPYQGPEPYDAVVLAAAGTRDEAARGTVELAARGLAEALGVPCRVGYASAADPTPGAATTALRETGARRVAVASYFLAPGQLYRTAVESARAAGAVAAAAPLGAAAELAQLVRQRAAAAAGG